jgi:hypothetical protein
MFLKMIIGQQNCNWDNQLQQRSCSLRLIMYDSEQHLGPSKEILDENAIVGPEFG